MKTHRDNPSAQDTVLRVFYDTIVSFLPKNKTKGKDKLQNKECLPTTTGSVHGDERKMDEQHDDDGDDDDHEDDVDHEDDTKDDGESVPKGHQKQESEFKQLFRQDETVVIKNAIRGLIRCIFLGCISKLITSNTVKEADLKSNFDLYQVSVRKNGIHYHQHLLSYIAGEISHHLKKEFKSECCAVERFEACDYNPFCASGIVAL